MFSNKYIKKYLVKFRYYKNYNLKIFNILGSTNDYLLNIIKSSKIRKKKIIFSKFQISGKGRYSSKWYSGKNKSLLMSVYYKSSNLISIKYFNFITGYSLLKTLSIFNIHNLKLKYPNDIYVNNKKIAGILIYVYKKKHIIIGIGLNINTLSFLPLNIKLFSMDLIMCVNHNISKSRISALIITNLLYYLDFHIEQEYNFLLNFKFIINYV